MGILLIILFFLLVGVIVGGIAHDLDAKLFYRKHRNFKGFFWTFDTKQK